MEKGRIRHMAIFSLKHDLQSRETAKFLNDGKKILSSISFVENFEVVYQTSEKSNYDFGFSMEFVDLSAYEKYNNHPDHVHFVEERWKKEVDRFQEIDFQIYT
ncbi:Dabb family protein [Metabacillus litoralis]|uniref:Dabb family protein n=1 Tax=Metabacillus litoralis TaxID=152268 RepID=UPI001CFD4A0D|nr:Dabb family protein [Metabacillus litoralis]